MNKRIFLSEPHMSGSEIRFIQDGLINNQLVYGENVDQFENTLENYLKENVHVACISSGTAALHLALVQLGVGFNDEVLCQTFTFCGSANPIKYVGALPVFVDSEEETWNMCPKHLEKAIKDRIAGGRVPKAIILVHLYGMPAKIDAIVKIANQYQIPVIEDAAEALGSTYKGRKCGTFGDFSILSFNGNKIITTSGGGAMVCGSEKDKEKTIFYATQARDQAPHYEHTKIGYNYRMSNISAGIGRGQMEVLDKYINLRRQVNMFYVTLFKNVKGIMVMKEPNLDYYSNFWLSCIVIDESAKFTAEEFRIAMAKENIETRPLWKPMHLQPVFKGCPYYGKNVSEKLFKTGLCLPSSSNLTLKDFSRIKSVIIKFIRHFQVLSM